jgi:predicted transcriptional regulator
VLTRHGRGVAVVLAVDDYERLHQAAERGALAAALREGERDVEAGRTLTHDEMRAKWLKNGHEGALNRNAGSDPLARRFL